MHAEHFEMILKCLIKRNRHRSLYAVACMERTQVRFAKYVNTLTFWYLLVAIRRFISHHRTTKIARNDTAAISSPLSKKNEALWRTYDHSPFAFLSHESPKQHLTTVVHGRGDQRPASNDYYPLPAADGRHRARRLVPAPANPRPRPCGSRRCDMRATAPHSTHIGRAAATPSFAATLEKIWNVILRGMFFQGNNREDVIVRLSFVKSIFS